ncbi:hypothetical protein GC194_15090 [bacterium]|nr:hypothetical protein [bacterium]
MNHEATNTQAQAQFNKALSQRATTIRQKLIQQLDHYLVEFETAYLKGKGKLYWCVDANEVFQQVNKIIDGAQVSDLVVNNSPLIHELQLQTRLQNLAKLNITNSAEGNYLYLTGLTFMSADVPSAYFNGKGTSTHFAANNATVVVVASIDQLLPGVVDMHAMAPIVSKNLSEAFEIVSLTTQHKLHFILVDNGRSSLLAKSPQNHLLEIAHPQSFLSDSHSQNKVLEQLYYGHLGENDPQKIADDFCVDGYAAKNCMLDLPVNEIIIALREAKAEKEKSENDILWRTWKGAMLNRKILNRSSFGPLSLMKTFYRRGFGSLRAFPKTEKQSFTERWLKERPAVVESRKLTDIPKGQLLVRKPATDGLEGE